MGYQTRRLDHFGIVAGMCDRINLVESIDSFFPDQARHVTIGEAVKAMVINALGFSSRPLYLSPEFFRNKPVKLLFRPSLQPDDFNDDCLGRALDALFQQDITTIFAHTSSEALSLLGIEHRFYHLDTSSFSFHGKYEQNDEKNSEEAFPEESEPVPIKICRGYSKDKRPELKQAVLSMICAHKSNLPLWLEALDGNSSDKKTFSSTIKAFTQQLREGETPCIIADSAFYTAENLEETSGVFWLTRVPETLKLAKELIQETEEEKFTETSDADYQLFEAEKEYGGFTHRWILVRSKKAKEREWGSFQKKLQKAKDKALKELEALKREEFNCWEDGEAALCKAEKKWRYHKAEHLEFEQVYHYEKKGRPKKDAEPDRISWKITGELLEDLEAIQKVKNSVGKFILATNMPDEQLSNESALTNYKAQGYSVERGFRFLKDPMFFAESMYLKKPSRIMGLMMVMTLSLLVYSLAERELREKLQSENESLPDQKGKPTQKITMRRVFQMFEGIDMLLIGEGESTQKAILNLNDHHHKIFVYLGRDVRKYYELD